MTTKNNKTKRIYLDYASSAPVLSEVINTSKRLMSRFFGNPSSIHKDGVCSKLAIEEARKSIAEFFDAHSDEIIFTGSGTEANFLALSGVAFFAKKMHEFVEKKPHIITTNIEHPSVLENCKNLESLGFDVTYLSVENDGIISLKELKESLREETILVSVGYANNEIGVIQPVKEIAKVIRHFKKQKDTDKKISSNYPLFHIDACQTIQYLDIGVDRLGIDLLSWNGTKIGGPRGIGCLYIKRGIQISPIYFGGGQERGMRSGTENTVGIIGLSIALKKVRHDFEKENIRLSEIRNFCVSEISKNFPKVRFNGSLRDRLCNNVNISFENFSSELLVLELDAKGISVSAGSACSSTKDSSSHVLKALYGIDDEKKWGSVRISFGRETKKQYIVFLIKCLKNIFDKYNKADII